VYRNARVAAAQAAVTRAAEYADAVGGRLVSLLELADTGMSSTTYRPMMAVSAGSARAGAPRGGEEEAPVVIDLEPETQVVHASVEARFTMTQPATLRS
jgi:hypothetical protein